MITSFPACLTACIICPLGRCDSSASALHNYSSERRGSVITHKPEGIGGRYVEIFRISPAWFRSWRTPIQEFPHVRGCLWPDFSRTAAG